jgi:hypothetical protein
VCRKLVRRSTAKKRALWVANTNVRFFNQSHLHKLPVSITENVEFARAINMPGKSNMLIELKQSQPTSRISLCKPTSRSANTR